MLMAMCFQKSPKGATASAAARLTSIPRATQLAAADAVQHRLQGRAKRQIGTASIAATALVQIAKPLALRRMPWHPVPSFPQVVFK